MSNRLEEVRLLARQLDIVGETYDAALIQDVLNRIHELENLLNETLLRCSELEQQVAEYEARDSRYWHSIQKRTDGQAQRIQELEDLLIRASEQISEWQDPMAGPFERILLDIQEALEAAPELNTASPETVRAIKCVTGQDDE